MNRPVDLALARLERRLRGPRRLRRDMLAEIRDGLDDAATAYEAEGVSRAAAADRAIEDLGDVDALARALQDELAARQARNAAWVVALGFLPLIVAWDLVWRLAPPSRPAPSSDLEPVYAATDLVQLAAGIAAAALVLALRRTRVRPGLCRVAGLVGLATPILVAALSAAMLAFGPWGVEAALLTPGAMAVSLASVAVMAASALFGARCLAYARGTWDRRPSTT